MKKPKKITADEIQSMENKLWHLYRLTYSGAKKSPFMICKDAGINGSTTHTLTKNGLITKKGSGKKAITEWSTIKPTPHMAKEVIKKTRAYMAANKRRSQANLKKKKLKSDLTKLEKKPYQYTPVPKRIHEYPPKQADVFNPYKTLHETQVKEPIEVKADEASRYDYVPPKKEKAPSHKTSSKKKGARIQKIDEHHHEVRFLGIRIYKKLLNG